MDDGALLPTEDPFADLDPERAAAPAPTAPAGKPQVPISLPDGVVAPVANDNEQGNPFAEFGDVGLSETTAKGAFARGAERAALPAAASLVGAGAGAAGVVAGAAALGTTIGPWGTVGGAIVGGLAAGYGGQVAQSWVLSKLPDSWVDTLGLDDRMQRLDEAQHGTASFLGGLVPYTLAMRPGSQPLIALPENATAMQRVMSNKATSAVFGGAINGGMELGQEYIQGEVDWQKVGIATAFGMVWNQPTKFGQALTSVGERPFRAPTVRAPTVAEAGDLKVMGPGVTESVFQGTQEQAPSAAMTAQETARAERMALGETPEPDLHGIARQMEPELFAAYDDLQRQRDTFAAWHGEGGGHPATEAHLAATDAQLRELSPEIAAAYRRAEETLGPVVDEPAPFRSFAEMLAARENETGRPPDAGQIQAPQETAPGGGPGIPDGGKIPNPVVGAGSVADAGVPGPQRTIGEQRASIANDVAEKLIAAGRPEDEARAAGQLVAARYVTRASRFEGKLGTPEELYAREGAAIAGPEGRPRPPAQVIREVAARGAQQNEAARAADTAAVETAAKPHEPGLISQDFDTSDRIKNEWRKAATFTETEPFVAASWHNQRALGGVGDQIAAAVGVEFKNPGIKARSTEDIATIKDEGKRKLAEASRRRLETKAKKHGIGGVTDQVRGGFDVQTPAQADQVIAELSKHFPVVDEGWQTTAAGYFDRKAYVRFPDGMIGEVQIWPPGMFPVKDRAHGLYEGVRELPSWHPMVPQINKSAAEVYAPVRAALSDEWKAVLGSGGSEPNRLPNAPAESTTASEASAALTSDHFPPESTQASEGVQKQGSPSSEQDLTSDMFGTPAENVGPHAEPVNSAIDAADKINSLSPGEQKRELPKYTATAEQPAGVDQPAGVFMFDPTAINVDAKRFQFKSGGDEYGVTGALRSVTKWNPAKAQAIIVWEQTDGKLFVADGHQRAGLARRLTEQGKAKGIELPGILYREKDGVSADDIRAIAAVTNIANGSGSAIDGAKVLRARPDLMDGSLPLSVGKGKQAAALARLGDEPFKMVVNDVVPEHYGAVVGELIPNDPARQEAAIKAIARFEPKNADEAAVLTQRVAQAELAKAEEGAQGSMFGDLETVESTAGEEMKIVGRAIADLKKDKGLFRRVLANAERIEQTGSQIERGAAESIASDAEVFAKTLSSDAYSAGPIRDELVTAARDLKNGKSSLADASERIVAALRTQVEAHGLNRPRDIGGVEPQAAKEFAQNKTVAELESEYHRAQEVTREAYQVDEPNPDTKAAALAAEKAAREAWLSASRSDSLFEPGAEGKPQQLIPGVAPVTQRDLIQAAANKPLKPRVAQKDAGGLFGDSMDQKELFQIARGKITISPNKRPIIRLLKDANASTFVHESGHQYLEEMMRDVAHKDAPDVIKKDAKTVRDWFGIGADDEIKTKHHEKFARGFEQYIREGVAPSKELAGVFSKFRDWLLSIYQSIRGLGQEINPDIRAVFDRLLEMEPQRTVVARPQDQPSLLHDIHEAEARTIEPHEAEPAMDRVLAEHQRYTTEFPPEVSRELETARAEIQAEDAIAAGEGGAGGIGVQPVEPGGSPPGAQPEGGAGGAERGPVKPSGDATRAEGVKPVTDRRSGLGDHASTALAPGPADLFGPRESQFTDRAGNIRIENLTTNDDVAQAIRDSAAENNDFIGDRRGVITDGQVVELADALGMDAAKLNQRHVGQAFNAEQIVAARKLLIESATDVSAAMRRAATGTDEDVMAYAQAKDRHQMIQAQVSGITAEAGRALRAFRSLAGQEAAKGVDQFIREATGKTLFQLRQEAQLGLSLETPQQVSKFMMDAQNRSFGRMVFEFWINSILSGPSTHATNIIGNAILAAQHFGPETAIAALLGRVRSGMGREGQTVRFGEIGAAVRGARSGMAPALMATGEAAKKGAAVLLPGEKVHVPMDVQPHDALAMRGTLDEAAKYSDLVQGTFGAMQGLKDAMLSVGVLLKGGVEGSPLIGTQFSHLGAIPDIQVRGVTVAPIGTIVRAPGRFLATADSFFRSLNYSMAKNALAYRTAAGEGLRGTEFDARVAELRSSPPEAMMEEARGVAVSATLMSRGGQFVQAMNRLTSATVDLPLAGEIAPLKFVAPFVNIAGQILNQSIIQRSPVGLLSKELRADLAGKNGSVAQDMATARMLLGTAITVGVGMLAAEGFATGSGPKKPEENSMWRMAGNQAHSVRIGSLWYKVDKLGPLGLLMGMAADLYEVSQKASAGEYTKAAAFLHHAFVQNILDQSFMKGPADLIQAVSDPDRYGERYIRNFLSSYVPNVLAQHARREDPYMRETRTVIDAMKARIPGVSESLAPKIDIWGEPMPNQEALGGKGVTGIYVKKMNDDPVNKAMLALGVTPGAVEKKIRGFELSPEQYEFYARTAGRMTKMRLDTIVKSPDFERWPREAKVSVIQEVINGCRETARGATMAKWPNIPRDAADLKLKKLRGEK